MRAKERIDIVMEELLSNRESMILWLSESNVRDEDLELAYDNILKNSWRIYKYWSTYYDQRFGQMLFNLGQSPDGLYHREEIEWMVDKGYVRKQDVVFWGSFGLKQSELEAVEEDMVETKPDILDFIDHDSYDHGTENFVGAQREWENKIPEIVYKPISELDTLHIKAILDNNHVSKYSKFYKLFVEELEYRNKNNENENRYI